MAEKNRKNIMVAFVSLVHPTLTARTYPDLAGKPYTAIQTNEAAIIDVTRQLKARDMTLDRLYLVASDTIDTSPAPAGNEFGSVTQFEFLRRRLLKAEPDVFADHIEKILYHDSLQIDVTLRDITKIFSTISAYQSAQAGAEIYLYADLTGGFRYSSVILLAIMQLLEHSGIHIGRVCYTDYQKLAVYDVTALEQLYKLVSGADEFVKFGSIESVMDYFAQTDADLSPELDALLLAMDEFSYTIKVCHTGFIHKNLQRLAQCLRNFEAHHGDGLEENLFASLLKTIHTEYGALLEPQVTDFAIIRWCVKKGFLQQAMTLCTEWLPIDMDKYRIAYTNSTAVRADCEEISRKWKTDWHLSLINTYHSKGPHTKPTPTAKKTSPSPSVIREAFRTALKTGRALPAEIAAALPGLQTLLEKWRHADTEPPFCGRAPSPSRSSSKATPHLLPPSAVPMRSIAAIPISTRHFLPFSKAPATRKSSTSFFLPISLQNFAQHSPPPSYLYPPPGREKRTEEAGRPTPNAIKRSTKQGS